jgi:murein DD-endopeptidase MepM/ murein hydrolase activator NlpD
VKPYTGGVRHDYKDTVDGSRTTRGGRWLLFTVGLALPLVGVSLLFVSEANQSAVSPEADVAVVPVPDPLAEIPPPAVDTVAGEAPEAGPAVQTDDALLDLLVQRGDTLEELFRRNGLDLTDLAAMVNMPDVGAGLKRLKPGDHLEISHRDSEVVSLRRELDEVKVLSIARGATGFEATMLERPVDLRTSGAHGVIESSLFEAGVAAGMSDRLTMAMAGIFEWDIDFIQDVREGDEFTVIYEELWRDGAKLRNGEIVAAEFVNQGKVYRAARFRDASGHSDYFTPDGHSMRKAFLRAPLEFTRISSRFNPSRKHPVLNTIRAHRGVDYAAPTGTPIRAAGDGKVTFRGVQGGYGNVIVLQHSNNITTLYGHMSRFAGAKVGNRVKQGEIIGYVGKTGLATGPHLHYEYRVDGVHRNPLTAIKPPADPVPAQYRNDFVATTAPLWQQLDLYQHTGATAAAN